MNDWYATAAVRRWTWTDDEPAAGTAVNYFTPRLVAALGHPSLRDADPALHRRLQQRHLFRYLAATETIELELVNPALCIVMQRGDLEAFVPQAYQIYTDEGFHAAMCLELRQRLSGNETAWHTLRFHSAGLSQLFALCAGLPERYREAALLTAACMNETLITPSLRQATDLSVLPLVRRVIDAHAADEAVHHAYFSRLFPVVWERLDNGARSLLAELIPALGQALLRPDWDAVAGDLVAEGLASSDAARVVDDLRAAAHADVSDRASVAGMVRMLERSGATQYSAIRAYVQSLSRPQGEFVES